MTQLYQYFKTFDFKNININIISNDIELLQFDMFSLLNSLKKK